MKVRVGFVSNSSSSSFLCLGVSDEETIQKLLDAEGLKKNEAGYFDDEGYGQLEGKVVEFYGTSEAWYAAGWGEEAVKKLLEKMALPEARKKFVTEINKKLKVKLNIKDVDLFFGEASSD